MLGSIKVLTGMKKNIFICASLILLLFVGCARRVQDPNKLVIWHWMTDRDKVFQELAEKYENQTGIKVVFELYAPSDIYSQKVIASAQAHVLPDIFGILDKKKVVSEFIKGGFIANLTEHFKANDGQWESSLFQKALAVNQFSKDNPYGIEEGIYGVPIDVTNIQMLYNKKLLKKAGIDKPPRTFEEFLETSKALQRVGIVEFVSGWGEMWMVDCFASNYAFNIMGQEKVMATYKGEVLYTDPDWIKVFNVFEKLRDNKVLAEGIVTKVNKYAEQDFALERAAFAFNGSWCVNVYYDMNPELDYGVMLPPAVNNDIPMRIWGGAGSSFVVNNNSTNKEKAIDFLKWLTDKDQQVYLAEETKNLPANRQAVTSISRVLSEFASSMDSTTHPKIWTHNEEIIVFETFVKGIQSIIIGEKTANEVAVEVQAVKAREIEKQKRRFNK